MSQDCFKIRVTGPEATGKSTLCKQLSAHYGEPWVSEAARDFLVALDRPYIQSDLDEMLRLQLAYEQKAIDQANQFIICDTGPEVFWVWSMYGFGSVSPFIERTLDASLYEYTLLLDIDLPWSSDPLREHPGIEERSELLAMYKNLLSEKQVNYELLSGSGEERFQKAIQALGIN